MMKPTFFLRIAAVLTLIHAALHTIGGVFGEPGPGPATVAVAAMKMNAFPVMGSTRTYWDFYRGLGLGIAIFLTVEAIVFWLLGSLAKTNPRPLRPVLVIFLAGYIALAVNSYFYFFFPPVIVEFVIAACLFLAIVTAKSQPAAYSRAD